MNNVSSLSSADGHSVPFATVPTDTAEPRRTVPTDAVSESRHSLSRFSADEERELLIAAYARRIEAAMAKWDEFGCFADRGVADFWRIQMEEAIRARSPEQVARMEAARGLS